MTDYLKGVQSDSPADDEPMEGQEFEQELDETAQEPDADTGHGDGEEGEGEKSGRTIENVYRELSRKQEEFQAQMMSQFMDAQRQLIENLKSQPEPEKKTGTLDDMSVTELETFRAQVAEQNPEKLGEFDDYLNQRRVDERVSSRMSEWEKRQRQEQLRSKAQQDALRRYPELATQGSPFYTAVNARLNELGDAYVEANPRAVLDAANDVAAEMGVSPRQASKAASMRGRVASKSNSNPKAKEKDKDEDKGLSDSEHEKIASRLSHAMPKGKKFDKKSLQERNKFYRDNLQFYLRG
jgi:hypothetical protein